MVEQQHSRVDGSARHLPEGGVLGGHAFGHCKVAAASRRQGRVTARGVANSGRYLQRGGDEFTWTAEQVVQFSRKMLKHAVQLQTMYKHVHMYAIHMHVSIAVLTPHSRRGGLVSNSFKLGNKMMK